MLSTIARLATYIGTCLRRAGAPPQDARDASARSGCRAAPLIPIAALVICLLFLSAAETKNFIAGGIALAVGALIYCLAARAPPAAVAEGERMKRLGLAASRISSSLPALLFGAGAGRVAGPVAHAGRDGRCRRPGCSTGGPTPSLANAVVVVEGAKIAAVGVGACRSRRARRSSTSATRRSCRASSTRTRT